MQIQEAKSGSIKISPLTIRTQRRHPASLPEQESPCISSELAFSAKHSSAQIRTGHVTHKTAVLQGTAHSRETTHTTRARQVPWSVFLNKSRREEETC